MSDELPVIDAHVHLWDPKTTPRAVSLVGRLFRWNRWAIDHIGIHLFPRAARDFVGDPEFVMSQYLPRQLAEDHAGLDVRGIVHVEAAWHGRRPLAPADETRWLESLGRRPILHIVGKARLDDPALERLLTAHREASDRFVGVRDTTAHDPARGVMRYSEPGRMQTTAWRQGLEHLASAGLTLDAWCYGGQLGELADALATVPEARVALCHLGTPIGIGGPFAGYGETKDARASILSRWKDDLARIAELPRVHAKLSGLAMPIYGFGWHTRPTPPSVDELAEAFAPLVEHSLATFGPQRCLFGSNFPMDKVSAPLSSIFAAYRQLVAAHDPEAPAAVFHDTARAFYGSNAITLDTSV